MKKSLFVLGTSMLFLASCTTGKYTASREYDDVYYSSADKLKEQNAEAEQIAKQNAQTTSGESTSPQNNSSNETIGNDDQGNQRFDDNTTTNQSGQAQPDYTTSEQQGGNTYITNNYYDKDDYYDYAYSAQLRRFYHPCGWGYYDTYYTNSYLYDYNPYSWGVSIYLGYNFWQPYHGYGYGYAPGYGVSVGIGYGYPSYGYGYPSYIYDPWYGSYGAGYNQGYNNGYMAGYYNGLYSGSFNPYYYNSYDSYSYYYGPRGRSSSLNTTGGPRNISQLYSKSETADVANTPNISQASFNNDPFIRNKHDQSIENARHPFGELLIKSID